MAPTKYTNTIAKLKAFASTASQLNRPISIAVIFLLAPFRANTASNTGISSDLPLPKLSTGGKKRSTTTENEGSKANLDADMAKEAKAERDAVTQRAIQSYVSKPDTHSNPRLAYAQLQSAVMADEGLRGCGMALMPLREADGLAEKIQDHVEAVVERESEKYLLANSIGLHGAEGQAEGGVEEKYASGVTLSDAEKAEARMFVSPVPRPPTNRRSSVIRASALPGGLRSLRLVDGDVAPQAEGAVRAAGAAQLDEAEHCEQGDHEAATGL